MTRTEILAPYRPIRAGIRRVLSEATKACGRADLNRAIRQVAPWAEAEALEEEFTAEMLVDVALFEPNQRGRRAFDRFLAEKGESMTEVDWALAERMAGAWFSIFRVAERHEAAGLWLEDLLAGQRRVWLVDEALEVSASEDAVIGLRLFDAGPFHAGFGIIVAPDAETLDFCLAAKERGEPLPFRHSLAATLYGDQPRANAPPGPADLALLEILTEMRISSPSAQTMPGTKKAGRQPLSNPRNTPQPRKRR
ncbi:MULTISPECIES: hypothetical protein [Microvirga]|uniref:Uncharacterized protein n=1 Tax=Microvirga lotononidis TaxID=864069 RepID=I4YK37_9HYPH|nr:MULTISPECIES: hypothetical protein [Microvirga]EIM24329.1 hypothetical protein MicloDRAFT_00069820 [Microvirga lotononidis]WQO30300.1 hypothetical protein U0023_28885 [Microvirga lotononidis]